MSAIMAETITVLGNAPALVEVTLKKVLAFKKIKRGGLAARLYRSGRPGLEPA